LALLLKAGSASAAGKVCSQWLKLVQQHAPQQHTFTMTGLFEDLTCGFQSQQEEVQLGLGSSRQ
jgi:hypothetical protein